MANSSFFKNTGTSATLQTSFAVSVEQAEASQVAAATSEAASAASATNSAASAAAALASQNAASNSEAAADADAISTAADVLSTAGHAATTTSDSTQTNLDRIATAADVVSTNADAVQTAADRVQTGSDVTASSASASAALASENASSSSETNSAASAAAALASQNAASASETAADADAVQTAADRVQTGSDVTASSASAAAALASQNAASSSATASSDSAAAALVSQNAASTSQTAAATSATNAATSANAAANPWSIVSGTSNIEYDAGDVIIQSPASGYRSLDFKSTTSGGFAQDDAQVVSNPDGRGVTLEAGTLSASNRGGIANGGVLALRDDDSNGTFLTFHTGSGTRTGVIQAKTNGDLSLVGKQSSGANGVLDLRDNVYVRYPDGHIVKQVTFDSRTNKTTSSLSFNFPDSGTNGSGYWAYQLSDHDAPVKKTQNYVLDITMNVSGRFMENTGDPGWRAYFQYYNNSTGAWTTLQPTDVYHRQRYADRGTANYAYGVITVSERFTVAPSTARYASSGHANENRLLLRGYMQGAGGTSSDDLDLYFHSLTVTEIANGD